MGITRFLTRVFFNSVAFILFYAVVVMLLNIRFGVHYGSSPDVFSKPSQPIHLIINLQHYLPTAIFHILAYIALLFNALYIVYLNKTRLFLPGKSQIPAFFYLTLTITYIPVQHFLNAQLAVIFILMAIYVLTSPEENKRQINKKYFESAFLTSIGVLFFYPFIFCNLLVVAALFIYRNNSWREWVTGMMGMALPFILFIWILYMFNIDFDLKTYNFSGSISKYWLVNTLGMQIWTFVNVFVMIMGSIYELRSFQMRKIQHRRNVNVFFWLFLLSALYLIINFTKGAEVLFVMNIALSYLFSHYFIQLRQNLLTGLLMLIYVILPLAIPFF